MNNIIKMRKNHGMSQVDLSKALGMRQNTLCQYETGKRQPNITTLKKIAEVLDCTVDDLIKD